MWVLSMNIKFKKVFGIALLICVLIPIIIHFCFKVECNNTLFVSTWKSGDMLQYCGTVLAALIAIIGVYLTLDDNRNKNEQNMILNVRPYLNSFMSGYQEVGEIMEDLTESQATACIYTDGVRYSFKLSTFKGQKELHRMFQNNKIDSEYFIFYYEIQNIGLGPAMRLQFKINENDLMAPVNLPEKENRGIYVFVEKELIVSQKRLSIDINLIYSDILEKKKYEQNESFEVFYDEDEMPNWVRGFENELSPQRIIN